MPSYRVSLVALALLLVLPVAAYASSRGSRPHNTAAPSITGSPVVGQTLSASTGTWTGTSLGFAFSWHRCDAGGDGCSGIGGAAAARYTLTNADAGHRIRVDVTATSGGKSASADSPATALVAAATAAPTTTTTTTTAAATTAAKTTTTAAKTTTTTASSSPSGESMPVGDLSGWHQIFTDDFTQNVPLGSFPSAVSTKWNPYPYPWKDTSKNGTYWPQKGLSEHNGLLDIWVHTETVNGTAVHVVNAPQPILPGVKRGQLYGRYVLRFRADAVAGYKVAWLLWPDSGLRTDGEIDFPEGNLNGTFHAYMHHQGATSGSDQDAYTGSTFTSWHTAVIEWLPSRCTFILDGKVIGNSTSRIPSTPMHLVLQTETALGSTPPANSASDHVYLDWIAIYSKA